MVLSITSGGSPLDTFGITVDGAGSAITTGSKGYRVIPYPGTITKWYLEADVVGDVQFDLKVGGVSVIGAGNKPILSTAQSGSAAVSGWTNAKITPGTVFEFVVDSAATITRVTLAIQVTKG